MPDQRLLAEDTEKFSGTHFHTGAQPVDISPQKNAFSSVTDRTCSIHAAAAAATAAGPCRA